mmetsp:Transcript_23134/g.68173  ORF Transcript_23134/g.68173 Transcript_23134/m.68173 type:complete len:249 (+) Transcript_23134:569-1315(+)
MPAQRGLSRTSAGAGTACRTSTRTAGSASWCLSGNFATSMRSFNFPHCSSPGSRWAAGPAAGAEEILVVPWARAGRWSRRALGPVPRMKSCSTSCSGSPPSPRGRSRRWTKCSHRPGCQRTSPSRPTDPRGTGSGASWQSSSWERMRPTWQQPRRAACLGAVLATAGERAHLPPWSSTTSSMETLKSISRTSRFCARRRRIQISPSTPNRSSRRAGRGPCTACSSTARLHLLQGVERGERAWTARPVH